MTFSKIGIDIKNDQISFRKIIINIKKTGDMLQTRRQYCLAGANDICGGIVVLAN